MSDESFRTSVIEGDLQARGLRVAVLASRFNHFIVDRLVEGALDCLRRHGAAEAVVVRAPGAWELPLTCKALLAQGRFDAVVSNPPFHVGSRSVPALGRAFIAAAARALKRDGQFLMVANRHLPYEDVLRDVFGRGELLAEQGGFKVYRAWEPKP